MRFSRPNCIYVRRIILKDQIYMDLGVNNDDKPMLALNFLAIYADTHVGTAASITSQDSSS